MKTIKIQYWKEIPKNYTGVIEWSDGSKCWYKEGKKHREDGPAIEWASGTKQWYINGLWHREDGPAVEHPNGTKYWFKEGKWHREDGPACEYQDGTKQWYKNGNLHREDGPAVEYSSGTKEWYLEDKHYAQINLNNYVVLDSYKGKHNLTWYKLLTKDKIFEYPDIPGLITK